MNAVPPAAAARTAADAIAIAIAVALLGANSVSAQTPHRPLQPADALAPDTAEMVERMRSRKLKTFPPIPDQRIRRQQAVRTSQPPVIDGAPAEAVWRRARRSAPFVDLVTGKPVAFSTRVALLWDAQNLYVAYWIQEPNVQAKFKVRDKPIWQDNDVELFLAFDHAYYELELNAFNTLYEGFFVWQKSYDRFGFTEEPGLDIRDPNVKHQPFNGVGFGRHPRGPRTAFLAWDYPGLKSAVQVQGTLNDDSDEDEGWTVELALPWSGLRSLAKGDQRAIPPRAGDVWRMDFSRFNQYHAAAPHTDSGGWALSPHGVWDSHIPEAFPYVTFAK